MDDTALRMRNLANDLMRYHFYFSSFGGALIPQEMKNQLYDKNLRDKDFYEDREFVVEISEIERTIEILDLWDAMPRQENGLPVDEADFYGFIEDYSHELGIHWGEA